MATNDHPVDAKKKRNDLRLRSPHIFCTESWRLCCTSLAQKKSGDRVTDSRLSSIKWTSTSEKMECFKRFETNAVPRGGHIALQRRGRKVMCFYFPIRWQRPRQRKTPNEFFSRIQFWIFLMETFYFRPNCCLENDFHLRRSTQKQNTAARQPKLFCYPKKNSPPTETCM